VLAAAFAAALFGCAPRTVATAWPPHFVGERIATALRAPASCRVSDDGLVWYEVRPGPMPPTHVAYLDCPRGGTLDDAPWTPIPRWAAPPAHTQTRFVAGSLQDEYSRSGTYTMEHLARAAGIPMTWMIGNLPSWHDNLDIYLRGRDAGDDVQTEPHDDVVAAVRANIAGFVPVVSIEGAGHERYIEAATRRGSRAIWGIAWNSSGVDVTVDRGTPWGAYCADPTSYKRPARDGRCDLLSIEWTARDLTRAFLAGHEEWYSTDPDDLQYRATMLPDDAAQYAERLVDAYAAAGEFRPLLVMAQQESGQMGDAPGSRRILSAMYARAKGDGMRCTTMRAAAAEGAAIARLPRAVAFPYLPAYAPFRRDLEPIGSATIDYVDEHVAMTFVAGRTMPRRVFDYDVADRSAYDRGIPQRDPLDTPTVLAVAADAGGLWLRVSSPRRQRYAFALWSDADAVGADPHAIVRAGRAGFIVPVDLVTGVADVRIPGRSLRIPVPLAE
jgi:hypothetical protein